MKIKQLTRQQDFVATSSQLLSVRPSIVAGTSQMERRQDIIVVRLHNILLQRCDNVSRGRNNKVQLVRLHDVSNKSQTKHPTTSHWYVTETSQ